VLLSRSECDVETSVDVGVGESFGEGIGNSEDTAPVGSSDIASSLISEDNVETSVAIDACEPVGENVGNSEGTALFRDSDLSSSLDDKNENVNASNDNDVVISGVVESISEDDVETSAESHVSSSLDNKSGTVDASNDGDVVNSGIVVSKGEDDVETGVEVGVCETDKGVGSVGEGNEDSKDIRVDKSDNTEVGAFDVEFFRDSDGALIDESNDDDIKL